METPDEIKSKVDQANELRELKKFKEAKQKYLDAASGALGIAKASNDDQEKLAFENVTKMLIQEAKACDEERFLEDLPSIPVKQTGVSKAKTGKKSVNDGLLIRKRPQVYALFVIKEGGIPIITHHFEEIKDKMEGKINEILFSGAISAISALMQEVIDRPIQMINFEDGVLLIRNQDSISYVLFAEENSPGLNKALTKFSSLLDQEEEYDLKSINFAQDISYDEKIQSLIKAVFTIKQKV